MSYRHNADFSFVRSYDLYNKYVTNKGCLISRQFLSERIRFAHRASFSFLTALSTSFLPTLVLIAVAVIPYNHASAQARVDLEDLSVKGELLNDNRLRMSSREATRIQDRVKYRKNFRPEIIDGSDVRVPASETLDEAEVK